MKPLRPALSTDQRFVLRHTKGVELDVLVARKSLATIPSGTLFVANELWAALRRAGQWAHLTTRQLKRLDVDPADVARHLSDAERDRRDKKFAMLVAALAPKHYQLEWGVQLTVNSSGARNFTIVRGGWNGNGAALRLLDNARNGTTVVEEICHLHPLHPGNDAPSRPDILGIQDVARLAIGRGFAPDYSDLLVSTGANIDSKTNKAPWFRVTKYTVSGSASGGYLEEENAQSRRKQRR